MRPSSSKSSFSRSQNIRSHFAQETVRIGDEGHVEIPDFGPSSIVDATLPNSLDGGISVYIVPKNMEY
jgi:hypothetical protein